MLTVVTFKWYDPNGRWNNRYLHTAHMVNVLQSRLYEVLKIPHRFVCITDDPSGVNAPCFPVDPRLMEMGHRYPKLSLFDPDFQRGMGGDVFLSMDLDCVVVKDFSDIFTADDFKIWGATARRAAYNSSMVFLRKGVHHEVYTKFSRAEASRVALKPDEIGSDQVWIEYKLGSGMPKWTNKDGILSFRRDVDTPMSLPDNAKVVFFNGGHNPYSAAIQYRHPWIEQCLQ